ncbi:MAG: sugar phosphate isomerase/epimerase [Planctomycetes bacterium]|nr:sugar phosphate isomerase/epimerase [Planctomycetota bacterium]
MRGPEVGVVLDSLGQPVKESLQSASRLGLRRIEMPAVGGEVSPDVLSQTGRRHLQRYVAGLGLQLSALGGDLGGSRFGDNSVLEERLERTRRIIEMAADLRVPVLTTYLGRFDSNALRRGDLTSVVHELADMADRMGTFVAFESGGTDPSEMASVLKEVDCQWLGVCYDPASLLIDGYDPIASAEPTAGKILIARARDAVSGSERRPGHETPLGHGEVDWARYLAFLEQSGYNNAAFLRRTESDRPLQDIAEAKAHMEAMMR